MDLYIDDFNRVKDHLDQYPNVIEIFKNPRCHWLAKPQTRQRVESTVSRLLKRALPAAPSLVLYNIPGRDAGNFSKGGLSSNHQYIEWIEGISNSIQITLCCTQVEPIIILEPDALPLATGDMKLLASRIYLLNMASQILSFYSKTKVYIDVGHPRWLDPSIPIWILKKFNPEWISGFSVNVSNFVPLEECLSWSKEISNATGFKCIIDTSRNGAEVEGWCNPPGARLGVHPTLNTGYEHVDAFLWVKVPGESDGYGNKGPRAGTFWPQYAHDLLIK